MAITAKIVTQNLFFLNLGAEVSFLEGFPNQIGDKMIFGGEIRKKSIFLEIWLNIKDLHLDQEPLFFPYLPRRYFQLWVCKILPTDVA